MAIKFVDEADLTVVGNAIRAKTGGSDLLTFPAGMAEAVSGIQTAKPEQAKSATPSLSAQTITPDSGKVLSSVSVSAITKELLAQLDGDFVASNILQGVDLFGLAGTATAGGGDDGSFRAVIERTAVNPTLPSDLTKIGDYAFTNCANLALTSLPSGVTNIESYAFQYCTNLALTSLPSGVTNIGNSAFNGCTNLALTSLPSGVTNIDNSAFNGCTKLVLTSLPSNITRIGMYAFYGCTGLTEISIPSAVTTVDVGAFYNCTGLTTVTFMGTPNLLNSSAFTQCTNLTTINVPWAPGVKAYAPWGATKATINYNYTGG